MVTNVVVVVGIGSQAAVHELFSFLVSAAAILNFGSRPSSSGQCPQCQVKVERGRKYGGSLWNRVAIYYRSKVISSSGLVAAILNRQSTTSGCIDFVIISRKCGGSRLNDICMFLEVETEVTSTSRKSPIFPWRWPNWFSRYITRRMSRNPELLNCTLEEQVLTFFLKLHRSQKYSKSLQLLAD